MHVVPSHRIRNRRSTYLPHQRGMVTDEGLGGFNVGKMLSRMVKFTPSSFKFKNIVGAVGSVAANIATGGMGSVLAPKSFGAHGSVSRITGAMVVGGGIIPSFAPRAFGLSTSEANIVRGITAAAGVAVGGVALAPMLPAIGAGTAGIAGTGAAGGGLGFGSILSGAGSLLGPVMSMFGGGGGAQPSQPQQDVYGPQPIVGGQPVIYTVPGYDTRLSAQPIAQSLMPTMYPTMPDAGMNPGEYNSLFDTQAVSPYSQLKDVGVVPYEAGISVAGMRITNTTLMMIGGGVLVAWVLFGGKSSSDSLPKT